MDRSSALWDERTIVSKPATSSSAADPLREIVLDTRFGAAFTSMQSWSNFELDQVRVALPDRRSPPFSYSGDTLLTLLGRDEKKRTSSRPQRRMIG